LGDAFARRETEAEHAPQEPTEPVGVCQSALRVASAEISLSADPTKPACK
jgi:hypothetical protein